MSFPLEGQNLDLVWVSVTQWLECLNYIDEELYASQF